jgi:hypothetical protein
MRATGTSSFSHLQLDGIVILEPTGSAALRFGSRPARRRGQRLNGHRSPFKLRRWQPEAPGRPGPHHRDSTGRALGQRSHGPARRPSRPHGRAASLPSLRLRRARGNFQVQEASRSTRTLEAPVSGTRPPLAGSFRGSGTGRPGPARRRTARPARHWQWHPLAPRRRAGSLRGSGTGRPGPAHCPAGAALAVPQALPLRLAPDQPTQPLPEARAATGGPRARRSLRAWPRACVAGASGGRRPS